MCHARKERVLLIGTDQRITSGPAARTAASRGRIHGCTRIVSRKVRFFSLAPRALSIHGTQKTISPAAEGPLTEVLRTTILRCGNSGNCAGFRMPAARDTATGSGASVRKPPKNEPRFVLRDVPAGLWGFD